MSQAAHVMCDSLAPFHPWPSRQLLRSSPQDTLDFISGVVRAHQHHNPPGSMREVDGPYEVHSRNLLVNAYEYLASYRALPPLSIRRPGRYVVSAQLPRGNVFTTVYAYREEDNYVLWAPFCRYSIEVLDRLIKVTSYNAHQMVNINTAQRIP